MRPLHLDHTANAEDVSASQPNWFVGYAETHWTQVIVKLRDNADKLLGNLRADGFGHGFRHDTLRSNEDWKGVFGS